MDSIVIRVLLEGQPESMGLRTVEGRKEQGGKLTLSFLLLHIKQMQQQGKPMKVKGGLLGGRQRMIREE